MYALLKPDGTFHRVVREDLPGGSTDYAAFGVVPVNNVVPEGYYRNGWQIVDGVCEPVLVETPAPPEKTPEQQKAEALRAEAQAIKEHAYNPKEGFGTIEERLSRVEKALASLMGAF